jgi:tRNA 2-thiouridine synthesizing protein A
MTDNKIIDARGYSCPQPVLITENFLKQEKKGVVAVLVDSGTARENVSRFAVSTGWAVKPEEQPDGSYKLILTK